MKEYRITVWKEVTDHYWYTLWVRKHYFLFNGFWKEVKPTNQSTFEKARDLMCVKGHNRKEGVYEKHILPYCKKCKTDLPLRITSRITSKCCNNCTTPLHGSCVFNGKCKCHNF